MDAFKRLVGAVRAISNQGTFSITSLPDNDEAWKGSVSVGGVILVDATGDLDHVVEILTSKLEKMSQRMHARLSDLPNPPDSSES